MQRQIDFTATFRRLREAFVEYNNNLRASAPGQYRKRSLKSTHMETARELVRCCAAHVSRCSPPCPETMGSFPVTHSGIGKNKLQHGTTIYRHLIVLIEAGMVQGKEFHGSRKPVVIKLNPSFLAFRKGRDECQAEKEAQSSGGDKVPAQNATCNDKESGNILETLNVNNHCGYVDKPVGRETPCGKQGNNKLGGVVSSQKAGSFGKPGTTRVAGDDPVFAEIIGFYTGEAWRFARTVLYSGEEYTDEQLRLTQHYISEYFSLVPHETFRRNFVENMLKSFCERVVLAKKYIDKSPNRFVPPPYIWFNRYFRHGFCGTLAWHRKVKQQQEKLKKHMKNLSDFCEVFIRYHRDPNIHHYFSSIRELGKLGDPKLIEYFNGCVVDPNNFRPSYLHGYYKGANR